MTSEYPQMTPEQEKEYAAQLWKAQQARNELKAMVAAPQNVRRRSKRELIKLVIGIAGVVMACWYMGYVVYTFLH